MVTKIRKRDGRLTDYDISKIENWREKKINEDLKKLRVVLKRAAYFITCKGKYMFDAFKFNDTFIYDSLIHKSPMLESVRRAEQLSFFDGNYDGLIPPAEERLTAVSGQL